MVSDYLNRENRDPNQIVQDFARSNNQYDIMEITRFADGIGVAFVMTSALNGGFPKYIHVSDYFHNLTGYQPAEIISQGPSVLQCEHTNLTESKHQMKQLLSIAVMDTRLVNKRKDGTLFGNHIRACSAPAWHQLDPGTFFGFTRECPISDCK